MFKLSTKRGVRTRNQNPKRTYKMKICGGYQTVLKLFTIGCRKCIVTSLRFTISWTVTLNFLLIIISFPFRVEILKKEQRLHAAWTTCISRLRRDLRDGFEESLISFCCVYLEAYVSSWEIISKNRNRSSPVCTQLLAIGTTIACSIMPFDDCHVSSFSVKRYVRFARWHCHLFTAPPRQKSWVTVILRGGANNFTKKKKVYRQQP